MRTRCKIPIIISTLFIASLIGLTPGQAANDHFDMAMGNIINSYLVIRQKLAQDSLEGIAAEAEKITQQCQMMEKMHGEHPKRLPEAHKKYEMIKETAGHAAQLTQGDIKTARKHFVGLGRPVIKYVAEFGQPNNVSGELFNYHCPMYPGNWLQEDQNMGNPMYGKRMPKCGKLVKWSDKKQAEPADMSKMKHDMSKMKHDM